MMKKTGKIAALLAAGALLFGGLFLSCSDDDGGNDEKKEDVVDTSDTGSGSQKADETENSQTVLPEGAIYVGLGTANNATLNITKVTVGTEEKTTLADAAFNLSEGWNDLANLKTVAVASGASVSYTFTQTAHGDNNDSSWELAFFDGELNAETTKGLVARSDTWIQKYDWTAAYFPAGKLFDNRTDGDWGNPGNYNYSGDAYTFLTTGRDLASTDVVVLTVAYDGTNVTITETINGTQAMTVSSTAWQETQTNDSGSTDNTEEETPAATETVWDLVAGSQTAADLKNKLGTANTKPTEDITIGADSGTGGTLVLLPQNGCSIKWNNGLQAGAGTKYTEIAKIVATAACTLTVEGKGSSDDTWTSAKINGFKVNNDSVYERTEASDTNSKTWTVSLVEGDNTISVSGMLFTKFSIDK